MAPAAPVYINRTVDLERPAYLEGPEVCERPLPPLPVADRLQHRPSGGRGVGQDFHGGGRGPVQQVR